MKVASLVSVAALTLMPVAALAHGGSCGGKALQAELPGLFAQADADGDGSLTPEEFKTFRDLVAQKRAEVQFKRLDANGDGKVTLDEMNAFAAERQARHQQPRAGSSK